MAGWCQLVGAVPWLVTPGASLDSVLLTSFNHIFPSPDRHWWRLVLLSSRCPGRRLIAGDLVPAELPRSRHGAHGPKVPTQAEGAGLDGDPSPPMDGFGSFDRWPRLVDYGRSVGWVAAVVGLVGFQVRPAGVR